MDTSTNNSRYNVMDIECARAALASTSPLPSPSPEDIGTATTISTIILQSHPIQIVVGILQVKENKKKLKLKVHHHLLHSFPLS